MNNRNEKTSQFKLKVWFAGEFAPTDGQPRTFYSYEKPDNPGYGFNRLVTQAEKWRVQGRWSAAEIYKNDPDNEENERRVLKFHKDGTRTS